MSTIEAHDAPIYGVQFHPERPLFEFAPSYDISHTPTAKLVSQAFANFLVAEASHSPREFAADKLDALVIENFTPHYTGIKQLSIYKY